MSNLDPIFHVVAAIHNGRRQNGSEYKGTFSDLYGIAMAEVEPAIREAASELATTPEPDEVAENVVDITPTWAGLMPAFIAMMQNVDHEGQAIARDELAKCARSADQLIQKLKEETA